MSSVKHGNNVRASAYWYMQILSNWNLDSKPSILIHFDSARYLINCPEGTQRLCFSSKTRLKNISGILHTRCSWETMGGLPGMSITLADMKNSEYGLHGPVNTSYFLACMRPFIYREGVNIKMHEYGLEDNMSVCDETMRLETIHLQSKRCDQSPLTDKEKESIHHSRILISKMFVNGEDYKMKSIEEKDDEPLSKKRRCHDERAIELSKEPLKEPSRRHENTSLCYIISSIYNKRKFDNELAKKLGVPFGKIRSELTDGNPVKLEDGRVITPEQVTTELGPQPSLMVIDVPDVSFIPSLVQQATSDLLKRSNIKCIVHILGEGVSESEEYRNWIPKDKSITNILMDKSHQSNDPVYVDAFNHLSAQHNFMPDLYLKPSATKPQSHMAEKSGLINAKPGMTVKFYPKVEYSNEDISNESPERGKSRSRSRSNSPHEEVRKGKGAITFLGTGSMIPQKFRNVSGILLQTGTEKGNFILDVGEGSSGTMKRFFEADEYVKMMNDLRVIYMSHAHADHHLGLVGVLLEYLSNKDRPELKIIAPKSIILYVKEISKLFDIELKRLKLVDAKELLSTGDGLVKTTPVVHCPDAFGVSISVDENLEVIYSGDTRPCKSLVRLKNGQCETVLIHEATFSDEEALDAQEKMHSTVGEARSIGYQMNAKHILLTHFSQKAKHDTVMEEDGRVVYASDGLRFRLC